MFQLKMISHYEASLLEYNRGGIFYNWTSSLRPQPLQS